MTKLRRRPTSFATTEEDRARVAAVAEALQAKAASVGADPETVSHSHVMRTALRIGLDTLERRNGITRPRGK